ncbi:MAG: hypothetical protein ACR2QR_00135 [Woeseiaceae bacterium]
MSSRQYTLSDAFGKGFSGFLKHHSYLLALIGFLIYLGLLRGTVGTQAQPGSSVAQRDRRRSADLLVGALSVYYFLIGYLVGEQPAHRYEPVVIFAMAMCIHIIGVNHTVRQFDPVRYDRVFGYVLGGMTLAGWILGMVTDVPDILFALVFSFVVGALMIVAFVFELRQVSSAEDYCWCIAGSAGFSALLLIYERLADTSLAA